MTLEVIKFRDVIRVSSIVGFVRDIPKPTIEIEGEDFTSVESVQINDTLSPGVVVLSRTRLIAEVPGSIDRIRSISVLSADFTYTAEASRISFRLGNKTKKVTGLLALVQLFTKWLLQSPGSDIFNPERGGGLQRLVGQSLSTNRLDPLLATITRSVDTTARQIRSAQLRRAGIPLDERLLAATVVGINVFEPNLEASARVRLEAVSGRAAVTNVEL